MTWAQLHQIKKIILQDHSLATLQVWAAPNIKEVIQTQEMAQLFIASWWTRVKVRSHPTRNKGQKESYAYRWKLPGQPEDMLNLCKITRAKIKTLGMQWLERWAGNYRQVLKKPASRCMPPFEKEEPSHSSDLSTCRLVSKIVPSM